MKPEYLNALVCPVSKQPLQYRPETQELWSRTARLAYPIKDGIPILLEQQARQLGAEELA